MLFLFKNADVFLSGKFRRQDFLVTAGKIEKMGTFDAELLRRGHVDIDVLDCEGHYIIPGIVDSQSCLVGGSGESGFLSQPPRITIEECIRGGITTVVGSIGVDTTTRTMSNLFASVRAYKEAGLSAFAYTGGYELPPKTLTGNLTNDLYFVDEIIGVGEVAVADRRASEPDIDTLAKVVIESYNSRLMTGKAGVTRVHIGEGKRRLQTFRDMFERHEIQYESLYFTHLERSQELVKEGIDLARKGSYVDFDIQENDLHVWYKYYRDSDGPVDRLSFSTDAGACGPGELWQEIQKCVLEHAIPLEQIVPHITWVPAQALKLQNKGTIADGKDADFIVVDKKNLEIKHVVANGNFFLKGGDFKFSDQSFTARRRADWYGIRR